MKPEISAIVSKSSVKAAPLLLGFLLCRRLPEGVIKLRIVEIEAYHQDDPASHSYAGLTKRTAPMFEAGGHLYVYLSYGMHYCLNIVTGPEGVGEAVLIRAGEPVEGIEIMRRNRGREKLEDLANGPGKLAQALGIADTQLSGSLLGEGTIWLEVPEMPSGHEVVISKRVGITKAAHQPWRFFIKDSPFVSKAVHKQL